MFRKTLVLGLLFSALAVAQDDAFDEAEDAALDAADDFEDEAEDVLEEDPSAGVAVGEAFRGADGQTQIKQAEVELTEEEQEAAEEQEVVMTEAEEEVQEKMWTLLIGIVSIMDTLWWLLWGWFIYIQTSPADGTMLINSGGTEANLPISWFWNSLADAKLSWTALQYLWIWIVYMIISVPEMIFWAMHMAGNVKWGTYLFNIWVYWPGLYGGWILYLFPVIWPIVQMAALEKSNQPGYTNAAVSLIVMCISWLATGLVHVFGYSHVERMNMKLQDKLLQEEYNTAPPAPVVEAPETDPEDVEDEDVEDEGEEDYEEEEADAEEAF